MTVNGHIENGQIIIDDSITLPEGMRVRVELVSPPAEKDDAQTDSPVNESGQTLYERWKPLFGMIKDGPTDFADNHDHYIHGQPKK